MNSTAFPDDSVPARTMRDVSGCRRDVAGILQPATRKEVLSIVGWAREKGVQLHPFSCGKNWGFGSQLPVPHGSFLLDLSRLRGLRLNLDQDFVELETGVTQGELYDALAAKGNSHYFNVTGAGRSTSVLGNALERGIGYFGSRKDDLLDLEIITGTGDIIWSKGLLSNPHHTGLGPDLTGAFLQSGWGVVINARLRLQKRPPYMGALLLQLLPEARVQDFFEELFLLRRENLITSVPHVANRHRMIGTFGHYLSAAQLVQLECSAPEWSCLAPVGGDRGMSGALLRLVQERMRKTATCRLVDEGTAQTEPFLAPAIDLILGKPNDFALPGVSYSALGKATVPAGDLDASDAGLLHLTPTCSANSAALESLLRLIDQGRSRFTLSPLALTVNLLNPGTVVIVISVPFDRRRPECARKVKAFAQTLLRDCGESGFIPYRLGLEDACELEPMTRERRRLLREIEHCCDPRGIFAASRYHALWSEASSSPLVDLIHLEPKSGILT